MNHNTQLLPIDAEGIPQWCNFFDLINALESNPTQAIEEIAAQMFYDDNTDNTDIKAVTNTDFTTFCNNLYRHLRDDDDLPLRTAPVMTATAAVVTLGMYSADNEILRNSTDDGPTKAIVDAAYNRVAWVNPLNMLMKLADVVINCDDEDYLECEYDDYTDIDEDIAHMPKGIHKTLTLTLFKFVKRLNTHYRESW